MKKVLTSVTVGVASIGLIIGTAGFANAATASINTTGPDSTNKVVTSNKSRIQVKNNNKVKAQNTSTQSAWSGDATTKHNTTGGSATSGAAENTNGLSASVMVDNTASAPSAVVPMPVAADSGAISNTGPDSSNVIKTTNQSSVHVTNNNHIDVVNTSTQTATTGDARVSGNTTGGSATSGAAANNNSTTMTFEVSN